MDLRIYTDCIDDLFEAVKKTSQRLSALDLERDRERGADLSEREHHILDTDLSVSAIQIKPVRDPTKTYFGQMRAIPNTVKTPPALAP